MLYITLSTKVEQEENFDNEEEQMPARGKAVDAIKRVKGIAGFVAHIASHELQKDLQSRHGFGLYRFWLREAEPMFGFKPEDSSVHMRISGVISNRHKGYKASLEIDVIVNRADVDKLTYSRVVVLTLFEESATRRYKMSVPHLDECGATEITEVTEDQEIEVETLYGDEEELYILGSEIDHLVPREE